MAAALPSPPSPPPLAKSSPPPSPPRQTREIEPEKEPEKEPGKKEEKEKKEEELLEGFCYLVDQNDVIPATPTSFGPIDENKAFSSGAPRGSKGEPGWDTRKRKSLRRISLQMPSITTTATAGNGHSMMDTDDLLPIASPAVQSARASPDKPYFPGQAKSLEGIALRSFCLGIAFALSVVTILFTVFLTSSPLWRLPFFFAALSTFHFLEFWTTAKYNTREAGVESFLLTANWPMYAIAHMSATVECLITKLIWPHRAWAPRYVGTVILLVGLIAVLLGQFIRASAMVQLGGNFNHQVQHKKKASHELVTTGLYGVMRHPSYFGFFWWGIGTQMVLGNPFCFVGYAVVLWRFFTLRVKSEEYSLCQFFGDDYAQYQKRVPTRIPFVS